MINGGPHSTGQFVCTLFFDSHVETDDIWNENLHKVEEERRHLNKKVNERKRI